MNRRHSLIDDIVECLEGEAKTVKHVQLSAATLTAFFADAAVAAKAPPPAQRGLAVNDHKADYAGVNTDYADEKERIVEAEGKNCCDGLDFDQLVEKVRNCRRCRLAPTRTQVVFSDGNPKAELMFIGEGPGADEDAQGIPFVGKAGQLLTKMINAMGFQRSEVYIANIVKCRPPGNRIPEKDEAKECLPYLIRQIELVRPKVLVLLGAVPLKYLFDVTGIVKARGTWLEFTGIKTMPTFHPAFLLREPNQKKFVWEDLQQVMKVFGKTYTPPPQKGGEQ